MPPILPESLAAGLTQRLVTVQQKNVLQPLLAMLSITGVFALVTMKFYPTFALLAVILFVTTFVCALGSYGYFMFKDPDRLQSEKFQLEAKQMGYAHAIQSLGATYTDGSAMKLVEPPTGISDVTVEDRPL